MKFFVSCDLAMPDPLDRVSERIPYRPEEAIYVGEHGLLVRPMSRYGVGVHLLGARLGSRLPSRLLLHLLRQHHPTPRMVQLG